MSGNIVALRLQNRIQGGLITGAELQAELGDGYTLGAFRGMCETRVSSTGLAASAAAMTVINASPRAADALLGSGRGVGRTLEALVGRIVPSLQPCQNFSQAVSDAPGLAAIAASKAAMDCIAASPAAMAIMVANPNIMNAIITNAAAFNAVSAIDESWAAFKASTALPVSKIPTMTSNTAPSGVASASSSAGANLPWRAFDKSNSSTWSANGAVPQWIQYEFANAVLVHTANFNLTNDTGSPRIAQILHSDDGSSWANPLDITFPSGGTHYFDVKRVGRHKYWRVQVNSTSGGSSPNFQEIDLVGFA